VNKSAPQVFVLNKPVGISSYDLIREIKRTLPKKTYKKIGHFGTLDPFASGLLLVGINGAMKVMDRVHLELPKTYLARGKFGIQTDTGDHTGSSIKEVENPLIKDLSKEEIQKRIETKFLGEYWQAPPAFSATKHEGKPLYEYARRGEMIEKPKKLRHIYQIEVVDFSYPELSIKLTVSTGTYIRTLFEEIAHLLESVGTLHELEREKIGNVDISQAITMSEFSEENLYQNSLALSELLPYAKVHLSETQSSQFLNGVQVQLPNMNDDDSLWVYDQNDCLLGLASLTHFILKSEFIIPRT